MKIVGWLSRGFLREVLVLLLALIVCKTSSWSAEPFYQAEFIIPLENWHNHGSCIIELPNGDLLAAWYHGSGEHEADDVKIEGARKVHGESSWRQRFVMADSLNFPDANPVIFLDGQKQLQLIWSMIVANNWRTSFLKNLLSVDFLRRDKAPSWKFGDTLFFNLRDFSTDLRRGFDEYLQNNPSHSHVDRVAELKKLAEDKWLFRMGWIARAHPIILPSGRIVLPLYSDEFAISMMAISDDGGKSWKNSKPIVGIGNIQPTVVRRSDGILVAYMRDAGPPPNRLQVSISNDNGLTWSSPTQSKLPNPDSGAEVIRLANGSWALAYNDTEKGRHSLAVSVSDDEGKSWRWTRHLELDQRVHGAGQFHYPSIIQTRDGLIHVTYSYFLNHMGQGIPNKAIKHASFNLEWVKSADPRPVASHP